MTQTTTDIRDAILNQALPNIPFDGWKMDTIIQAAHDLSYDDLALKAAFPDGMIDVLDAFADKADRDMLSALNDLDTAPLRTRDKIRTALITRWECLRPHKEATKTSFKFWLNPLRKPRLAKIIWRTADRIWDWAGDTSTDYNRYSKRTLLSGIIGPGMLIWINDDDDEMQKTISFVDARIENIMQFGKIVGKLKG